MTAPVSPGPIQVAIVDDDQCVRDSLVELITSNGWGAVAYATGRDFLQQVHEERPNCVILDLRLPDMSGLDVQAELVARGIVLPLILVSGAARPHETRQARTLGAAAVLSKPVDARLLLQHIERAVHPGT